MAVVAAAVPGTGSQALNDTEFRFLSAFVTRHCGITMGEHKRQLLQGRLQRRLRALGLDGFADYCELLRQDPDRELGELASAVSTNVTAFFRESHHFDYLAAQLPKWLVQRPGGRIRIWSAGCSTGEEPYSLAMVLAEALEKHRGPADALILATDLSPAAAPATEAAIDIARRSGAQLTILSVVDPRILHLPGGRFLRRVDQERARVESGVQGLVAGARAAGVSATFLVWQGDPSEAILEASEAEDVDLVVVGSHGRGRLGRLVLGSTSSRVSSESLRRVLVVPS